MLSRPVRGAWIETSQTRIPPSPVLSRPVRGAWIETTTEPAHKSIASSRPVRGAWIETPVGPAYGPFPGRAPYGARGLKPEPRARYCCFPSRRAPYGARGLKLKMNLIDAKRHESRPVRGAWIETIQHPGIQLSIGWRAPYGARGLKQGEGIAGQTLS